MTNNSAIIQTRQLTKQYGQTLALDHVDLSIPKGSIYGLVGNNGAGKTTFLKIILGQVYPTSGSFSLWEAQEEAALQKMRRRCGAIIETPGFYPGMTAVQNLEYYRIQRGIPGKEKVMEKLKEVGLADAAYKKFKQMSLGMKQRLGLTLALLGEPERYTALLEKELHLSDYKVLPDGAIRVSGHTEDVTHYSRLAVEQGIGLLALERREMQLEDYYMHLTQEAEQ